MHVYELAPGEESTNHYLPGGYHPVHLGDTFHDGTYEVVHKLGFGTYSTVWLVKDRKRGRYSSMKILAAQASSSTSEVDVMHHIQRCGSAPSGSEFVMQFIDEFEHSGPNGVHRCIISEVLGPPLSSDIEDLYPSEEYPVHVAKRIVAQIARGLEYLHHCGVVYGGTWLELSMNVNVTQSMPQIFISRISSSTRLQLLLGPLWKKYISTWALLAVEPYH
jgi:serine/threonine-protein kinase SRPK3